MTDFRRHLLLFLGIQLAIAASLLAFWPLRGTLYLASVIDKHERAAAATGPRVVFVGGSSLAFGLDSATVRSALHREPINLALQAGLGYEFALAEAAAVARRGDTIVLGLEDLFFPPTPPTGLAQLLMMEYPSAAAFIPGFVGWKNVLDGGLRPFRMVLLSDWQTLTSSSPPPDVADSEHGGSPHYGAQSPLCHHCTFGPIYRRRSFNGFGDHVAHWGLPPPAKFEFAGLGPRHPAQAVGSQAPVVEAINRFTRRMRRAGIRVAVLYSPIEAGYEREWAKYRRRADAEMRRRAEFEILGRIDDAVFPRELFFDSPFHLTGEGVTRYTRHVIERLTELLGVSAARTDLDLAPSCPGPPVRIVSRSADGWIGRSTAVCVNRASAPDSVTLDIVCAMPPMPRPVEVGLYQDGRRLAHVTCAEGVARSDLVFQIDSDGGACARFELRVDKTFKPIDRIPGSGDDRELGVVVHVPPQPD